MLSDVGLLSAVLYDVLHISNRGPINAAPKLSKHLMLEVRECIMFRDNFIKVEVRIYLAYIHLVDITIDISTLSWLSQRRCDNSIYILWRLFLCTSYLGGSWGLYYPYEKPLWPDNRPVTQVTHVGSGPEKLDCGPSSLSTLNWR